MKKIVQKIFSVKNSEDSSHKIFTILGFKFKFARKKSIKIGDVYLDLNLADKHELNYYKRPCDLDKLVINAFINNGDVVIDAGANIGYQTLQYLEAGASFVYSFEPIKKIYDRLKNIQKQTRKVQIYNLALSDKNGLAKIYKSSLHNQGHSLNSQWPEKFNGCFNKKTEIVQLKTLDDIDFGDRIDFLKIDVEGSEPYVFKGGKLFFQKYHPIVFIEIYDWMFEQTLEEIKKVYENVKIKKCVVYNSKLKLVPVDDSSKSIMYLLYTDKHSERVESYCMRSTSILGLDCFDKMLKDYDFQTVLDIGAGECIHSEMFAQKGKSVTSLDYGKSPYVLCKNNKQNFIIADFLEYDFSGNQYDAVWCSHVLEHQLNVNLFLKKVNSVLKENGVLAITVPPLKNEIVGGHVCLWNAGLILYNLILAGFDCKDAIVKTYGYNISVIVKKKSIDIQSMLVYDNGDISTIKKYLPGCIEYHENFKDISFNGDIKNICWID